MAGRGLDLPDEVTKFLDTPGYTFGATRCFVQAGTGRCDSQNVWRFFYFRTSGFYDTEGKRAAFRFENRDLILKNAAFVDVCEFHAQILGLAGNQHWFCFERMGGENNDGEQG